jgi:hypothetical protein
VRNFSPRTIEGRTVYLDYFIKWCEDWAIVRPGEATKPIIDRYRRWRKSAAVSPARTSRCQDATFLSVLERAILTCCYFEY